MAAVFEKPSRAQRFVPVFGGFDLPLVLIIQLLSCAGLLAMYCSEIEALGSQMATRMSRME